MEEPRLGVVEEKWRGRSSVAEHQLPKLSVVGSIPIARSNAFNTCGFDLLADDLCRYAMGTHSLSLWACLLGDRASKNPGCTRND